MQLCLGREFIQEIHSLLITWPQMHAIIHKPSVLVYNKEKGNCVQMKYSIKTS